MLMGHAMHKQACRCTAQAQEFGLYTLRRRLSHLNFFNTALHFGSGSRILSPSECCRLRVQELQQASGLSTLLRGELSRLLCQELPRTPHAGDTFVPKGPHLDPGGARADPESDRSRLGIREEGGAGAFRPYGFPQADQHRGGVSVYLFRCGPCSAQSKSSEDLWDTF